MRAAAERIWAAGLLAAAPGPALARAMAAHPPPRPGPGGVYRLVAVGKAAPSMAAAAYPLLGPVAEVLIVTHAVPEGLTLPPGAALHLAGHPLPDARGLKAAEAVEGLLARAGAADQVVALISGGASALLPAPREGLGLADKIAVTRLLLGAGWPIARVNALRQALSRLKGGGFLRAAAPAGVTGYLLSDVMGDDPRVIGSGLTAPPLQSRAALGRALQRAGLWAELPGAVRAVLLAPEGPKAPLPRARNILIGSNALSRGAMAAAAKDLGLGPVFAAASPLTGDVARAAGKIRAAALAAPRPSVWIWGGECTVKLKGPGVGGRCQELALRLALAGLPGPWAFLAAGSDGRDGPGAASGALVDHGSAGRLRAAGGSGRALLAQSDSGRALALSGDLRPAFASGTNVADLMVLVLG